jgi:serine/threonine protein kinase
VAEVTTAFVTEMRFEMQFDHSTDAGRTRRDQSVIALNRCIDDFSRSWDERRSLSESKRFFPEASLVPPVVAAVELIKADMSIRCEQGRPFKSLDTYYSEFPGLFGDDKVPYELVLEDFQVRKRAGEEPNIADYSKMYPDYKVSLNRMAKPDAPTVEENKEARSSSWHDTIVASGNILNDIQVGDQLDEFDLLAELGRGAFAKVFLARQISMQRMVALKISADHSREAQTMAQLEHAYIVRVFDQRILPEKNLRLLYMQYVSAGTLEHVCAHVNNKDFGARSGASFIEVVDQQLTQKGELIPTDSATRSNLKEASWPETVCWIGSRLAQALNYAHEKKVLHRDLKPANVLLAADLTPKLSDFNIAYSSELDNATPAAYFGGTLVYMSPEQLEAYNPHHEREPESLDGPSDIFSLGVVLWELLTGKLPYKHVSIESGWQQTLDEMTELRRNGPDVDALKSITDGLPPGLSATLRKCLEPNPEDRFSTAGELARQLELCMSPQLQQLVQPSETDNWQFARRRPLLTLVAAGLLPNLLISIMNISYNANGIIQFLTEEARDVFFSKTLAVMNVLLYTPAMVIGVIWCWPLFKAITLMRDQGKPDGKDLQGLRRKSLRCGHIVAGISFGGWLISAFSWPLAIAFVSSGPSGLTAWHWSHFFISQILCGLLAAVLVFFTISRTSLHALYPPLINLGAIGEKESSTLNWFRKTSYVYLIVGASVPILAITILTLIDMLILPHDDLRLAAVLLGVVGFATSLLEYWMFRSIQEDTETLKPTLDLSSN